MATRVQPDLDSTMEGLTEDQLETSAKLHVPRLATILDGQGMGGRARLEQLAAGSPIAR